MKIKDQLVTGLNNLVTVLAKKAPSDRKSNIGKYLQDIFVWQEVNKLAADSLKEAWATAQTSGALPFDDELRNKGEGEHIVTESDMFSLVTKVMAPRQNFDRDLFIEKVAKKFKIPVATLTALADASKVDGKAALSKRVLEAA